MTFIHLPWASAAIMNKVGYSLLSLLLLPPAWANDTAKPVRTLPYSQLLIHPRFEAPATVVSLNDSRIGAEINARIESIEVRVGEMVEPGALLARLDCGDYRLAVARIEAELQGLEAQLRLARQQLRRARSLELNRNASEELVDQRQADVARLQAEHDSRQAALRAARRDVGRCRVQAPFRAVVLQRIAQEGEIAAPGTPLLRILDLDRIEISAQVEARLARSLRSGAGLNFHYRQQDYPVKLRALMPALDANRRSREARLEFIGERALPGAVGRLRWRDPTPHLPADIPVQRHGQLGVFVLEEDRARFVALPGALEGRPARAELPPDSLVIVEGRHALMDGDEVRRAAGE